MLNRLIDREKKYGLIESIPKDIVSVNYICIYRDLRVCMFDM